MGEREAIGNERRISKQFSGEKRFKYCAPFTLEAVALPEGVSLQDVLDEDLYLAAQNSERGLRLDELINRLEKARAIVQKRMILQIKKPETYNLLKDFLSQSETAGIVFFEKRNSDFYHTFGVTGPVGADGNVYLYDALDSTHDSIQLLEAIQRANYENPQLTANAYLLTKGPLWYS